jgi:hypothetical protein
MFLPDSLIGGACLVKVLKFANLSRIVVAGALFCLAGCGPGSQAVKSGNFSRVAARQSVARPTEVDPSEASRKDRTASASAAPIAETPQSVDAATTAPFTVAVEPTSVTIAPGGSANVTVTTTVNSGFDQELTLTVSVPAGVHMHFASREIPAPGDGTEKATITVPMTGVSGTHAIHVTASDGTTSTEATLTLKVPAANPGATFQGCWQQSNGNSYQGVLVSVDNPGTYPFNAVLYYGTTCDPNQWADQIGFGDPLSFGGFDWIFWFNAFANQTDMSAQWFVGSDASQCVNYKVAPSCE